ncbi:universal stress protein [Falsihalocynthiibacter sp. S25ZX9]|uniref:universal stress protein n=1 Tax=Falsihalocynthiibacter sp. S25ZX9 TaxID=3240870 RepID=UPI00350FDAD5
MATNPHFTPSPLQVPDSHKGCDVMIFLEDAHVETSALFHAQKVANAFSGKVVLVHIMADPHDGKGPIDPVDWNIKKQKIMKDLAERARPFAGEDGPECEVKLLEGQCIGQVSDFVDHRQGGIAAALRSTDGLGWQSSDTACGVLLSQSAAILMIPARAKGGQDRRYRRILVPLDGSVRAEAALPKAVLLAKAENAELLLCYVVPSVGLTAFGVKDKKSEKLHEMVAIKNEQAGKRHLGSIKKSLAHNGLKVSTSIVHVGDVRRAILSFVSEKAVDFLVMATHGQSGHGDVATGDVARFILDRAEIPVLMVRHKHSRDNVHAFNTVSSKGVRQPVGTDG